MKKILIFFVIILITIFMIEIFYFWNRRITRQNNTDNIQIDGDVIYFDSLTLRQKLSQMIIVSGGINTEDITRFNVGGVYLFGNENKDYYADRIKRFDNSRIRLFYSTDLEGYWNPFKRFYNSKFLIDVEDVDDASQLGDEHGRILKELGFNMNFAPVAEANGRVWDGRGFNGSALEIGNKSLAYINALQEYKVLSVVKHYPGGSIDTADPHKYIVRRIITKDDLIPFEIAFNNVSAVMIGHVIASGEIDSGERSCSVSKKCIDTIKNSGFNGLIITDEINMKGLRKFYQNKDEIYIDAINAGNNIILDFKLTPRGLDKLLKQLESHVKDGRIDTEKVDKSVRKILNAKGYEVL